VFEAGAVEEAGAAGVVWPVRAAIGERPRRLHGG
jgi:hypothetical protein